ncbi:sodium channel subunit beta-2 isoform X2 [Brienomyrus brachyistius]|uniref:sodium channel subunit beta-2 isoform X2 n=1 Tax=Brienomyrus brachyistius TaxID=42636 RepID=UPI0020B3D1B9|nr:sodium channel subunit beta-2 isoform X2 [Brienomyrus brachyistius]
MVSSFQVGNKSWKSAVNLSFMAMMIFAMDSPASSMDVTVPSKVIALNGTTARLPCTFTSCYKIDINRFAMNWTYKETLNDTEEIFMTFKHRVTVIRTERFDDRVVFAGKLEKNDLSITISDVQLSDSGIYKCYVRNPPDRQLGNASIFLDVLTELPPPRDSTIAVVVGASVGGILAVLILSMVIIKCVRRRRKQELISDEQKMEEEGKTDAEGGTEEGTKHAYSLPEDVY